MKFSEVLYLARSPSHAEPLLMLVGEVCMNNLVFGCTLFGAAALLIKIAAPVKGKVRPWITPLMEPVLAVGIVAAVGAGIILVILGIASALAT